MVELYEDMSMSKFFIDRIKTHGAVHGLFAQKYIQKTIMSLKILGLKSASDEIRELNFAGYRVLTFYQMELMMSNVVLKSIMDEIPSLRKYF